MRRARARRETSSSRSAPGPPSSRRPSRRPRATRARDARRAAPRRPRPLAGSRSSLAAEARCALVAERGEALGEVGALPGDGLQLKLELERGVETAQAVAQQLALDEP